MNTMTQAHLEGLCAHTRRNQEGTKSIQKILRNGSKIRRFTSQAHTSTTCMAIVNIMTLLGGDVDTYLWTLLRLR